MGKLSQDSTLAGVRGKVGGLVVSSNATGGFVRPWFMPRVPRTPEQTAWVAKWNGWIQAWKTLDGAEVAAWVAASADSAWTRSDWFGQPYQPSGFNLWIMVAAIRDSLGLAISNTPPSGSPPVGVLGAVMALLTWDDGRPCTFSLTGVTGGGVAYFQAEFAPYNAAWDIQRNKPFRPLCAGASSIPLTVDVTGKVNAVVGRIYNWSGAWYRWRALSSTCVPGAWQSAYCHAVAV